MGRRKGTTIENLLIERKEGEAGARQKEEVRVRILLGPPRLDKANGRLI